MASVVKGQKQAIFKPAGIAAVPPKEEVMPEPKYR